MGFLSVHHFCNQFIIFVIFFVGQKTLIFSMPSILPQNAIIEGQEPPNSHVKFVQGPVAMFFAIATTYLRRTANPNRSLQWAASEICQSKAFAEAISRWIENQGDVMKLIVLVSYVLFSLGDCFISVISAIVYWKQCDRFCLFLSIFHGKFVIILVKNIKRTTVASKF